MNYKTCRYCGTCKPLNDFYIYSGCPVARCKACLTEISKARYRADPERGRAYVRASRLADPRIRMAADARARDKRKGLMSNIEAEQISIPDFCPVLAIPMRTQIGKAYAGSPSIDHIDPRRGAVPGNWAVISRRANELKRGFDALTLQHFIQERESGARVLRGKATLDDYRAVLRYILANQA